MVEKITKQIEVEEVNVVTKVKEKDFYVTSDGMEFEKLANAQYHEEWNIQMKYGEFWAQSEVGTFRDKGHLEEYLNGCGYGRDKWNFEPASLNYPVRKVIVVSYPEIPDTKDEWGEPYTRTQVDIYDPKIYREMIIKELDDYLE